MKKDVKEILKTAFILAAICGASATLLGVTNLFTKDYIKFNNEKKVTKALNEVLSGGTEKVNTTILPGFVKTEKKLKSINTTIKTSGVITTGNKNGVIAYYKATENGELVGYILELVGKGYGGDLKMLAYYTVVGDIIEVVLVSNSETPGIGKKAEESGYMNMFKNKGYTKPIPKEKGELRKKYADSITGATVTFKGVAKTLIIGSNFIKAGGIK